MWQAAYLPFGEAQLRVGTITNNLRFPGQYFDAETGLHYNWNRYYDPATGRYISPDPIGLDGGLNLYAYVGNDPVNLVDPEGLWNWGFGGVFGPVNIGWQSDQPTMTQFSFLTDLEIGGGFFICFDNPFLDECEDPKRLPLDVNIGTGKYTGISADGQIMCINIGLSAGLIPIDISSKPIPRN